MSEQQPAPVLKRESEVEYETLSKATGTRKAVVLGEADGAPNLAVRRYELDPGAEIPRHTNEIEHQVYTLSGEFVVGFDGEEHTVTAGDSFLIPAGVVHWFRNEGEEEGSFICTVPHGDDTIRLVEE